MTQKNRGAKSARTPAKVVEAEKLLAALPDCTWLRGAQVAEQLKISPETFRRYTTHPALEKYRLAVPGREVLYGNPSTVLATPHSAVTTASNTKVDEFRFEESGNTAFATSLLAGVRTVDDLLQFAKVDTALWEVSRYVINKWDMGSKNKHTQETSSHPLYQIKVWLQKRVVVEQTRELISAMLEEFKKQAPVRKSVRYPKSASHLLEISIFDLHLGKLCWAPETGAHYDVAIAQSGFVDALEALIQRASGFDVSSILFPIGNDFFNVDGMANETTAGTPQREDGRWQRSFVAGRKLMVNAIDRLREIAPVTVLMVPGNHDRERLYYLGDSLSGWFSKTPGVHVDNSPTTRKYFRFGQSLLGFTHGNEEKHTSLPLIMATEQPTHWAQTAYREFHVGHFHSKRDMHFFPTTETQGIRVRQIPSLCPPDDWHALKGYNGLRAAEAMVWHKDDGCVATFSFSPKNS
jgi:hypothetical protein